MFSPTKNLVITTIFITLSLIAFSQRRVSQGFLEIPQTQYDSCNIVSYLSSNNQIIKRFGKLTLPIANKKSRIFIDDTLDNNYEVYDYMGDIKNTKIALVKKTEYNREEFYLVNRSNGQVSTLIGPPVFSNSMTYFACLNNPGTDEPQRIQICSMKKGVVYTKVYLRGKEKTFLENITCIQKNSVLAKDNRGKYWKVSFAIEGQ